MIDKLKAWTMWGNIHQTAIAFDQLCGCLLGLIVTLFNWSHKVWADETMSAYLWRQHEYWYINILRILVDCVFLIFTWKWNHCKRSFENEQNNTQLPEEEH